MMLSLVGAVQSDNGLQVHQTFKFIEAFSILKIVFVLFVLPLLMYACRQKFTKQRFGEKSSFNTRDNESRADSRTKKDFNLPEKSSEPLVQNGVKKRHVRKKKPQKQNSEYSEEPQDANGARENSQTKNAGEEVKVVKSRNKAALRNSPDLAKDCSRRVNNSENPDSAGHVEHKKYANKRNKAVLSNGPDLDNGSFRRVKDCKEPDTACQVEQKEFANKRNKGFRRCDSHVDSVPSRGVDNSENSDHEAGSKDSVKYVNRHNNVVGGNYPANSQSGRSRPVLNNRNIRDSSNTLEHVKDVKRSNKVVTSMDANAMSENTDSSSPVKDVKNVKKLNEVVSSKHERDFGENPDTVDVNDVKKSTGGSRLFTQTICLVVDQDSASCRDHTKPGNRNRPRQDQHGGNSPVKTRAYSDVGVTSYPERSGVTPRRKSFSSTVKRDCSSGTERNEKTSQDETSHGCTKIGSTGNFSGGFPIRRWEKTNRDSTAAESKAAKDGRRVGTTPRRRSFDRSFEKDFRGRGPPEHHRPCPSNNDRSTSNAPENPELECGEEKTMQSADVSSDLTRTMDRKEDSVPYEQNVSTGTLRAPKDSAQTVKDIEMLRQYVAFRPAASQEPQFTPEGHVLIDPAVRERIANPEYPVTMPDKPFENLSYYDHTANAGKKSTNKSRVHGLFGRKWRKRLEKQQEKEYAEEDAKGEEDVPNIRDDDCPTFMIWGVCHRGDRCPLRHPSYRYLERPKRTTPEPAREEPKPRDPKSYAVILAKTRSTKPKEFFNDAVGKDCPTKGSLEEAWPALGSSEQGRNTIVPKAWGPKREVPIVPQVWEPLSTTEKAPRISSMDQLQLVNDELIANNLQADEYAQLSQYDGNEVDYEEHYDFYPEQDLNEDEYVEETEDRSSFHQESKVFNEEQFNCTYSSPVIMEPSTDETGQEPAPPKISTVCDICMDRPKDATLVCGHRYCYQCALQMRLDERVCAICRRCIVSVIKTYN